MNFYNTKNIEEIIKHYRKDNNNYIVEYLNGKSIILKDENNNLSININNLDSYSNKTIKKLKKELKHKNQLFFL